MLTILCLPDSAQAAEAKPALPALAPGAAHLQAASRLILEGRLPEAAGELEQAYKASADPVLQLRIGRLQQRRGERELALAAYRRFLAEAKSPHPGLKAEAEAAIKELSPPPEKPPITEPPAQAAGPSTPAQLPAGPAGRADKPPGAALPLVPKDGETSLAEGAPMGRRRNLRLVKIGSLLFSAGYLPAVVIPLALSGSLDNENAPSPASNYTLLVPLLGPFLSGIIAPVTNENGHRGQVASSWSAPWMLTSGVLQVAGFALMVYGAVPRDSK
jgi:hypothetical protein